MTTRTMTLAICLLCSAVPVAAQTTIPIGVHSAYLHIDRADTASAAYAIDLAALGLVPGYTILLEPVGDWDAGPGGDVQTTMLGIFSANATVLPGSLLHRIPGAIDAGPDNFSGGTWPNNEPTEVAEDFTIQPPGLSIVIPPGATTLFVTPADIYYTDNEDPDGDLGVRITVTSTTGVAPGTDTESMAPSASPNPFVSSTSIAFRLESSTNTRLSIHDVSGRRIRRLIEARMPPGEHHADWDGRDAGGRTAPAGTYFARLEIEGRALVTRIVRVR